MGTKGDVINNRKASQLLVHIKAMTLNNDRDPVHFLRNREQRIKIQVRHDEPPRVLVKSLGSS